MRLEQAATAVCRPLGTVAAGAFGVMGRLRGDRALHPQGVGLVGTLTRTGHAPPSGIAWVDAPGSDAVVARVSRSAGLPRALPDLPGVALRAHVDGHPVDLLMTSTGLGPVTRWVLTPHRRLTGAAVSTIIPLHGTGGPVLLAGLLTHDKPLAADLATLASTTPARPLRMRLFHATPRGPWRAFGHANLHHPGPGATAADTSLRFDAVAHPPPGSHVYRWAKALREPAYTVSRRYGAHRSIRVHEDRAQPDGEHRTLGPDSGAATTVDA